MVWTAPVTQNLFSIKAIMGRDPKRIFQEKEVYTFSCYFSQPVGVRYSGK